MAITIGDGFKLDGAIPMDLNYKWSSYSIVPASIIYEGKLIYDSSSKSVMFHNGTKWNPVGSISSGSSGGTPNYIIKWTGDTSIGNSIIYDTGSFIGIGTKTPTQILDISGNLNLNYTQGKTDKGIIYLGGVRFIHTYSDPSRIDGNLFLGYNSGNYIMGSSTGIDNWLSTFNIGIGNNTLKNNTDGYSNIAIGYNSQGQNTIGKGNIAIGEQSLSFNTVGSYNIAIGKNSLVRLINQSGNTAIGAHALQNNNNSNNVAIGFNTLVNNNIGYFNTAIGSFTGFNSLSGSNNIFIGYQSGYNELGSNKLYIANSSTNNLIYGEFDNKLLQFNVSSLKFTGISSATTANILCYNDTTSSVTYSPITTVLDSAYVSRTKADTKNGKLSIIVSSGSALDTIGDVNIVGNLSATSKSFLIPHPSKPNMTLRHGNLEGPEHGVYIRGKLSNSNIIELPEYWIDLVDEDSITVQLTSIGKYQELYVRKIEENKVYLNYIDNINCYYFIQAERKDISKIIVEEQC